MPCSTRLAASLVTAAVTLSACATAAPVPGAGLDGPVYEHVHGVATDPANGTVYVASHDGLFRSGSDGMVPAGAAGRDLMGFTITSSGRFLSSGHPAPGDFLPQPIGLAESTDGGATWTSLSLGGDVDFHALEVSGESVFGLDATNGVLRVSADGGRTWQERARLDALDIAADPADDRRVVATVPGGVATSTDGGRTFASPAGPQLAYVSWAPNGTVIGLDFNSGLHTSADGGSTWARAGSVPGGGPQAVTASTAELLAATTGGVFRSLDGGASFTPLT